MPKLTDAQRAFLENPYVGTATTLREDGSPHNTVVWIDVDDDSVGFNTAEGRAKPEHLRRDARAAVTVIDPHDPFKWVSVSGPAELAHDGAGAQIDGPLLVRLRRTMRHQAVERNVQRGRPPACPMDTRAKRSCRRAVQLVHAVEGH